MHGRGQPFDYERVAPVYDRHRTGEGPYLGALVSLAERSGARRALELGAGTGNVSARFLDAYACELVCLDLSKSMAATGREKARSARWVVGDATALPIGDAFADFIFGVLFLHHVADLDAFASEVMRVLRRGHAAFVTSPHDFIERHPMNAYFPSFAAIDTARFQPAGQIVEAMRAAGFAECAVERKRSAPVPIDESYVAKVEGKFISTYALLPDDEFARGLDRLRRDVRRLGRLDTEMVWECDVVSGRKT